MSRFFNFFSHISPIRLIGLKVFLVLISSFITIVTSAQNITNSYDSLSRLTQIIYPDSSIIKYSYDASGNRITKSVIQSPLFLKTVTFSGKVFLQGAYNTSSGTMNNTLNTSGILATNALNQPYNTTAISYAGTENVAPDFFAIHTDIVDWVILELRDAALPSTVIATRAAFVKQDGSLSDTDGVNPQITFTGVFPGNYYVAVRHRNHLGIRSAVVVDFTSGSGTYDFTTAATKAYQNQSYTSTVQIGSIWAMRAGNANSNNNVKYNGPGNDENQILNIKLSGSLSNVLNNVYSPEDVNMNGNVKWNGPGNDQNFLLNTVLNGSLSTVYLEQL